MITRGTFFGSERVVSKHVLDFGGWDEAPFAQRACHDVQVIHLEPIGRAARVVATRDADHIAIFDRHGFIQLSVVRVNALDAEAIRRVQTVIIGLFQIGDARIVVFIVTMARVAGPVTRRRENLCHQQTVGVILVLHRDVVDVARVRALTALGQCDAVRPDPPRFIDLDKDFHGKAAYLEQRSWSQQAAYLCTMTMTEHRDANGVLRYPVGQWPILDPQTGEVLVDSHGRRSCNTSVVWGPSVGKIILLGYIPVEYAQEGRELTLEYFQEHYPIRIEAVGYRALFDPDNERVKS